MRTNTGTIAAGREHVGDEVVAVETAVGENRERRDAADERRRCEEPALQPIACRSTGCQAATASSSIAPGQSASSSVPSW